MSAVGDNSVVANAGTLTINTATGTNIITYDIGASAFDVAASINQAGLGITAAAKTEFILGVDDVAGANVFQQNTTYSFYLATDTSNPAGGVAPAAGYTTVSFTTGGVTGGGNLSSADQLNAAAQAFNDAAGKTGFSARVVKTDSGRYGLDIVNESGKDLRINNISGVTVALDDVRAIDGDSTAPVGTQLITSSPLGSASTWDDGEGFWVTGQLTLDSEKSFSITDDQGATLGGFMTTNGVSAAALQSVANSDISTVYSAARTIAMADSALSAIISQRARYGALQSRFESTIVNLQTTSENLSGARSRIRDADFAAETAKLTRNQILQQAGIAMLAQANALPNQVLQLLQR
jgi:flagellin